MATPEAGRGAAAPGERCRLEAAGPSDSRRAEERHSFRPEPGVAMDQTTRSLAERSSPRDPSGSDIVLARPGRLGLQMLWNFLRWQVNGKSGKSRPRASHALFLAINPVWEILGGF